jgi:hypothetical protein
MTETITRFSNVKGIETIATTNHEKEHLLFIHHMKRHKEYTGNAVHGQMATVFCEINHW